MILHWLTSGWRSLVANPLFSLITVASLAIGCCGAVLAGSNIKQHLTFEQWVPEAEQIYVVTRKQKDQPLGGPTGPMGSSRMEGPALRRPSTAMSMPMRAAIDGRIPDLEVQTRVVRGGAILQEDQDEIDRRQQAGPPAPGEVTPPFKGTIYVDADFFDVFPLEFIEGSGETLKEPDTIVLTRARARRLFGNEPAVGKTVEGVRGSSLRVVGVVKDLPVATHLTFESIAGMRAYETQVNASLAQQQQQQQVIVQFAAPAPGAAQGSRPPALPQLPPMSEWNRFVGGFHYLKVAKGADPEAFKANAIRELQSAADIGARQFTASLPPGIQVFSQQWDYSIVPLLDMHLGGPDLTGQPSTGDITMLTTLAVAAIALLGVSAFNYVTLSLARSLRRRREVAVRKVLGAGQGSLIQQYLLESGMVTAIALVIGFALAWFLHPWFARAIGQPETLFDLFDPAFLAISLVGFALLAVAVGAYPALYLANVRPRTGLGEGGTASPGRIGQAVTAGLLGLQIAAATALLVVSLTMQAQAGFIENRPMGFSIKNKFQVNAPCIPPDRMTPELSQAMLRRCVGGTRELLEKTPDITKVAYFQGQLVTETIQTQAFGRSAQGEELGRSVRMGVDTEFLQFMGTKLLAGRFFDSASAYDTALIAQQKAMMTMIGPPGPNTPRPPPTPAKVPVIVTKAWLPLLGVATPEEAIGVQISQQPRSTYPFEIVGVVEDWQQRPLKYEVLPIVFVPNAFQGAMVESELSTSELRNKLSANWRQITGEERVNVNVNSLEDNMERVYLTDFRLMRAVSGFAVVAIIVAGLGVYGLSAFEMRRRVREIGIRKALGASPFMVGSMVIGRGVMFAAIASLLAWPVGFWLANNWLMGFIYRTELGWFAPLFATVIVIGFVALAVGLSSARAAAMRPAGALQ